MWTDNVDWQCGQTITQHSPLSPPRLRNYLSPTVSAINMSRFLSLNFNSERKKIRHLSGPGTCLFQVCWLGYSNWLSLSLSNPKCRTFVIHAFDYILSAFLLSVLRTSDTRPASWHCWYDRSLLIVPTICQDFLLITNCCKDSAKRLSIFIKASY